MGAFRDQSCRGSRGGVAHPGPGPDGDPQGSGFAFVAIWLRIADIPCRGGRAGRRRRTALGRGRLPRLSPLRHPRPRLRPHPLRSMPRRAPGRLLLQGPRRLPLPAMPADWWRSPPTSPTTSCRRCPSASGCSPCRSGSAPSCRLSTGEHLLRSEGLLSVSASLMAFTHTRKFDPYRDFKNVKKILANPLNVFTTLGPLSRTAWALWSEPTPIPRTLT